MQPEQTPTLFIGNLRCRCLLQFKPTKACAPGILFYRNFCAGVPSVAENRQLVSEQGLDPSRISALKYRGEGWAVVEG